MERLLLVLGLLLLLALLVYGLYAGWRHRAARQSGLAELPVLPADLGPDVVAADDRVVRLDDHRRELAGPGSGAADSGGAPPARPGSPPRACASNATANPTSSFPSRISSR